MKKVLLIFCFLSLSAYAGTGGGTSTPPAQAGLANFPAPHLGTMQYRDGSFLLRDAEALPDDITVVVGEDLPRGLNLSAPIEVANELGESKSYRVVRSDNPDELVLKARRMLIRASVLQQP